MFVCAYHFRLPLQVAFVYVSVRLLENITYSYLALYLVDYLHYSKVAINVSAIFFLFLWIVVTKEIKKLKDLRFIYAFLR